MVEDKFVHLAVQSTGSDTVMRSTGALQGTVHHDDSEEELRGVVGSFVCCSERNHVTLNISKTKEPGKDLRRSRGKPASSWECTLTTGWAAGTPMLHAGRGSGSLMHPQPPACLAFVHLFIAYWHAL